MASKLFPACEVGRCGTRWPATSSLQRVLRLPAPAANLTRIVLNTSTGEGQQPSLYQALLGRRKFQTRARLISQWHAFAAFARSAARASNRNHDERSACHISGSSPGAPCSLDNCIEVGIARMELKKSLSQSRCGKKARGVSGTARTPRHGDRLADNTLNC